MNLSHLITYRGKGRFFSIILSTFLQSLLDRKIEACSFFILFEKLKFSKVGGRQNLPGWNIYSINKYIYIYILYLVFVQHVLDKLGCWQPWTINNPVVKPNTPLNLAIALHSPAMMSGRGGHGQQTQDEATHFFNNHRKRSTKSKPKTQV